MPVRLEEYNKKRNFATTAEPRGSFEPVGTSEPAGLPGQDSPDRPETGLRFAVQHHPGAPGITTICAWSGMAPS